jgi:hypothetical protein
MAGIPGSATTHARAHLLLWRPVAGLWCDCLTQPLACRAGSMKRVASAVGEGAAAIALVHRALHES